MPQGARADAVGEVLAEARELGLLGPGPVEPHIEHARGFARAALAASPVDPAPPARVLDLGSGGGLPGLVLALEWPRSHFVLLDASTRRTEFLRRAVVRCGLEDTVTVCQRRAEEAGRDPEYRGAFDCVVARSFGPPGVVAECAAPLLRVGGIAVVSEPPAEGPPAPRWPAEGLAQLGLAHVPLPTLDFAYEVLRQERPCPERFPRRNGVPAKRPLF